MNRKSLLHLIEQARRHRDDAAADSAGARRQVDQAQKTLDMLSNYMRDHLDRAPVHQSVHTTMLHVREGFTRKLDAAIDEQARTRDALQLAADERRAQLLERQRRLLAFETLHDRREQVQARKRAVRDQRMTDEMAMQAVMRRNRGR